MSKIDRKKIIYAVLIELNKGNKEFEYIDFEIDQDIYFDVIKAMINDNLAQGFVLKAYSNSGIVFSNEAYITLKGIEFIENNSAWGKAYMGLKEFKSWIPGMGN